MFTYYGSKQRMAHLYPEPLEDTIIEPFCGSAKYSLHGSRWRKQVKLYDADPRIITAWEFLIAATYSDIMNLPMFGPGTNLDTLDLRPDAKIFLGYMISAATRNPKKTATEKTNWTINKRLQIATDVTKVKHWTAECLDFRSIPNQRATWFIDPPYQKEGCWYDKKLVQLDYVILRDFTKDRIGQVIACETEGADWADFKPLIENKGQTNNKKIEVIYTHQN